MDTLDESSLAMTPANASPPDFDFNLPCRYFKSSFARSLSLTNSGNNNLCKSLDYDMRSNNNSNSNNIVNMTSLHKRDLAPPLPQRRLSQAGSLIQQQNEANTNSNNKQVLNDVVANNINKNTSNIGNDKPPALPARRPLSLNNSLGYQNSNSSDENSEQKIQASLTQFQQHALKQAMNNNSNTSILPANSNHVHTNNNSNNKHNNNVSKQQQFNTNRINHFSLSNGNSNKNKNNTSSINCSNNNNNNSNFRRNNIVWPNQQNVEQDCNICDGDNDEDINSEYHDTITRSSLSDYHHYHNSHHHQQQQQQHQSHRIPTITTTNLSNNPQQQEQHQMSSYEVVNDTTTNVEAVILQNQVDTLQWQLKQVETSCDMYRAVMEEVARFLERYQSQKQLLQQQQQQLQLQQQQQQHQLATHKHNNNVNNNMEQIPRSKSLYQVYVAGGHEKSTTGGNNLLNETLSSTSATLAATPASTSSSTSYLRARSSTNLIDLKQTAGSTCNNSNKIKSHHSKDDHNFETGLTPSQSYSAFKDFTWRRSPKKANDNRFNNPKSDDVEEKLNQEAFRLLRTIHNLLNTSQHQPDIAHHRHSLAPASALNLGRLSKAMSTTSVMTLPGAPMHNSTNLTMGSNSVGSTTPDSSTASPCMATAASNNATPSSNNLAPEMLFLRSANMRDSRLSLRSSTDSSVHSTSSVASSASSKVETDEEPTTPFHSPPNILTHKQQQHNHLAGSSTEDESGFSSISSFPDIGVALSSTMLSSTPSSGKARTLAKELKSLKTNEKGEVQTPESRNSTLKANVVGLPLNSSQDMSHRWDSPSKTYHNASTKFQRFSALTNEDSNTVLWV